MVIRVALVIFLLFLSFVANAFVNPIPKREFDENFRPQYGVTFGFGQAAWYGLDPRESYVRMLDEFEFDWVRLPFFWDQMVTTQGELRIDDLRFAIEEAQKRDVDVIIALGAKTPYFPEYHWPDEFESQVKFAETITLDHSVANKILSVDKRLVEALSGYDSIAYWQVENEPLIANINKWIIDPSLVASEVEVVREADPKKRPVILNHAAVGFYDTSWKQLLPILKPGDVFAVNAFFKTQGVDLVTARLFGREIHLRWPDWFTWPVYSWGIFSPNLGAIKKEVETNGNEFWILEMQAEPYVNSLEDARSSELSYTEADLIAVNNFLRSYKIESIGFWGVHFWQYRSKTGDNSWIDSVKAIVN